MNKNTAQRVFRIMGWQVRKRPVGFQPRIQALPSVATAPNERWATDMCRAWCGRDNWATLTLVKSYGLRQAFITPYSPEQNGMVERVISTLKDQCVCRHRFETMQHASRVIGDWVGFYNHRRPNQALNMSVSAQAIALVA